MAQKAVPEKMAQETNMTESAGLDAANVMISDQWRMIAAAINQSAAKSPITAEVLSKPEVIVSFVLWLIMSHLFDPWRKAPQYQTALAAI